MSACETHERKLVVVESTNDVNLLSKKGSSLLVAQSVSILNGKKQYNLLWKCRSLDPIIRISWKPVYGLNWTTQIPEPGTLITLGGAWQETEIDSVWDLDDDGYWTISESSTSKGHIGVGNIRYKYPKAEGIHVVVGMRNSDETWSPIFVDHNLLTMGSSAAYKPHEEVKWWFGTGRARGTAISITDKNTGTGDFSKPPTGSNSHKIYTTYENDKWRVVDEPKTQDVEPPKSEETPVVTWPFTKKIKLRPAIKADEHTAFINQVEKRLNREYVGVKAEFNNKHAGEFCVSLGGRKPPRKREVHINDAVADISAAIRGVEVAKVLSTDIVWLFA